VANGAPVLILFGDFFIVIYFIMAYNYTQPYYNPCYPPNYNYGNCYPRTQPYVHHGYPQNYPAISYPGYAPKYSTNNAFTIVKSDKGDSVYALNSYDTLTLASSDTDNLIITGDKCNKKITFDLSGVVTSANAVTREKSTVRRGGVVTITDNATPTISAASMVGSSVLVYANGSTDATGALWDTGTNIEAQLAALDGVDLAGADSGISFDVTIVNNDATAFIFGALAAGLTSGSGASTDASCQIGTPAATGGNSATFRFVRTGTALYTIYRIV
jgi:hypothetical protein